MKPNTSRRANSEKYIICQSLKRTTTENIIDKFISIFHVLEKINFQKPIVYLLGHVIAITTIIVYERGVLIFIV